MRRSRSTPPVDASIFGRAFVLLARNPVICLAPLLAYVVQILLFKLAPEGGGGLLGGASASIVGFVAETVNWYGIAVATIVASLAWRHGRASFDDAWDDARQRAGDLIFAAIGFEFVVYIAQAIGSFAGGAVALVLTVVAYFFFIYTIPAAAIGGTPGGAAPNASVEIARRAPLPTVAVSALFLLAFAFVPSWIVALLAPLLLGSSFLASAVVFSLITALVRAIVAGYVALVLAKTFEDASYGRRWG